ncbi:MAG: hypothetical protein QMC67_17220 [Candidatus Wallbacteria bacterium]
MNGDFNLSLSAKFKNYYYIYVIIFTFLLFSSFYIQPAAAEDSDSIYSRNGEVYVMVGDSESMYRGVYACQYIKDGKREVYPEGRKLFGGDTKYYYSISVDQFRNLYVLSANCETKLRLPSANEYFPIDPPTGEGIVGIGADNEGKLYYDVLNYVYGQTCTIHGEMNFDFPQTMGSRLKLPYTTNVPMFWGTESDVNSADKIVGPADAPPQLDEYIKKYDKPTQEGVPVGRAPESNKKVKLTFPSGEIMEDVIPGSPINSKWGMTHWGTYAGSELGCCGIPYIGIGYFPSLDANQIRRIGSKKAGGVTADSACWYMGYYPKWYYHGNSHNHSWGKKVGTNVQARANWQRRFDFGIQPIKLWITEWVEDIPDGVVGVPKDQSLEKTEIDLETAFNTTNIKYKSDYASACGEPHADTKGGVDTVIETKAKLSLATTGSGNRYTFASLPSPKVKKAGIDFLKNGGKIEYGVPQKTSGDYKYSDQDGKLPVLTTKTCGIGVATKNKDEDWVYAAPEKVGDWDVIDFCVADQWDGKGGVVYMLLQRGESKKITWQKYDGYNKAPKKLGIESGEKDVRKDIIAIAPDGAGGVYYLTNARPIYTDNTKKAVGYYDPIDWKKEIKAPAKLVPIWSDENKRNYYEWVAHYKVRAATEVYYVSYYDNDKIKEGAEQKLSDVTVGFEEVKVLEMYDDPDGKTLISRGPEEIIGKEVEFTRLDIATINLAGPPVGNKEKSCCDIGPDPDKLPPAYVTGATNATIHNLKDGKMTEKVIDAKFVDQIEEDKTYSAAAENPPEFVGDFVNINKNSGMELEKSAKDSNKNGIIGGFLYSILPQTVHYYWKIEMLEPMRKSIKPSFPSKSATAPANWPPDDRKAVVDAPSINWNEWYVSAPNGSEAKPNFEFVPTEPGVYKLSMIASYKRYLYEKMDYPSYISERDNYKSDKNEFLFFDDGAGGGTANNGVRDGMEDYLVERYIVVTAKKAEPADDGITNIQFTSNSPTNVNENEVNTWSVTANVKFIRSIQHEVGSPSKQIRMETFNGIGCWDYDDDIVSKFGLPDYKKASGVYAGIEDYEKGALMHPSNYNKNTKAMDQNLRNFGEGAKTVDKDFAINKDGNRLYGTDKYPLMPPEIFTPPVAASGTSFYGTGTADNVKKVLWICGAGTQTNPDLPLSPADLGCIEYEWYAAAQNENDEYVKLTDKKEPAIMIAKGRLSDLPEFKTFNDGKEVVSFEPKNLISGGASSAAPREFKVTVNLKYAFDVPLGDKSYVLYIKFKYPKLKWVGRSYSAKSDEYAYYDLVSDALNIETTPESWAGDIKNGADNVVGLKIKVKDTQKPHAYFNNKKSASDNELDGQFDTLSASLPAGNIEFKGATTADPYPYPVTYIVCDNNPNDKAITSNIKGLFGKSIKDINVKNVITKSVAEKSNSAVGFTEEKVRLALQRTLTPRVDAKKTEIQNVVDSKTFDAFEAGYGQVPYRKLKFLAKEYETFTSSDIPYDYTGLLPFWAAGKDGTGNIIDEPTSNAKFGESKKYEESPAHITIEDNDPPLVYFTVFRPNDLTSKKYSIHTVPGTDGLTSAYVDRMAPSDPRDYNSLLRFDAYGSSNIGIAEFTGKRFADKPEDWKVNVSSALVGKQYSGGAGDAEIKTSMISGKQCFVFDSGSKQTQICDTYYDIRPSAVNAFDFYEMLGNDPAKVFNLLEDTRSEFRIKVYDNVDGDISPSITGSSEVKMAEGSMFIGAKNFINANSVEDTATLDKILSEAWNLSKSSNELITTFLLREPSPDPDNMSFIFTIVKDKSNNAAIAKIPIKILKTYFKRDTINIESRRSDVNNE